MIAAFDLAWRQYQAEVPGCPRCQSWHTVADGQRSYQLRTVFGPVTPNSQRRRCRDCEAVYQPLDVQLHAAGSYWPFATAA